MINSTINTVTIVGRLGNDVEVKKGSNSQLSARIRVATNEYTGKKDSKGKPEYTVNWHNIVLFNKLAEVASKHLKKGMRVGVIGRLQYAQLADSKTGEIAYFTSIIAQDFFPFFNDKKY